MFNIEWRSKEGYGDFITGLCYAHSSTIKYAQPVHINFHWPNPKGHLLSNIDKEPIIDRFNYIASRLRPADSLTISHVYESIPEYRFINELEEFNPLHGLWYPKVPLGIQPKLVAFWTSKHNLEFPGYHKDPLYDYWDQIKADLSQRGYDVVEITYRTPIRKAIEIMEWCEFGVGYEGMIHQLFKFMWKPIVVASQRYDLAHLLCPQAHIVKSPEEYLEHDIETLISKSRANIERLLIKHKNYMADKQDPTLHPLYGKPI